jgi:hypothetical protein
MEETSGFYKADNGNLLYGQNYVLNADYELRRENLVNLTLPVDGWHWFDTEAEARISFDIPIEYPSTEMP